MKIFLLILLLLVIWFVSAILSSLIVKKFFLVENENFWAIICTLFAPATFVTILAVLPFYFLYGIVHYLLEK